MPCPYAMHHSVTHEKKKKGRRAVAALNDGTTYLELLIATVELLLEARVQLAAATATHSSK